MKKITIPECIEKITKTYAKQAWLGLSPPGSAHILTTDTNKNHRTDPKLHRAFDCVWIFETQIFDIQNWQIVLDEAMRLIGEQGVLVIRFKNNVFGAEFGLKRQIARHPMRDTHLLTQVKHGDGSITSVIKVTHPRLEIYNDKRWTIGILSNGQKAKNIALLIQSIQKQSYHLPVEIVVAGPTSPELAEFDIRYICQDFEDDLPRISEKNNAIIEAASYENVMIIHDRYVLADNFFESFDAWGYDFDYISVAQQFKDGKHYPAYCSMPELKFNYQSLYYCNENKEFLNGPFLCGAILIFKRHICHTLPFNPLLLHAEAEDVEIAWLYYMFGIIPRINPLTIATTVVNKHIHADGFKSFQDLRLEARLETINQRMREKQIEKFKQHKLLLNLWLKLPYKLRQVLKNAYFSAKSVTAR